MFAKKFYDIDSMQIFAGLTIRRIITASKIFSLQESKYLHGAALIISLHCLLI